MEKLNIKINAKKNYAEIFINDKEQKKVYDYAIYQCSGRKPKVMITFEPDELEINLEQADLVKESIMR